MGLWSFRGLAFLGLAYMLIGAVPAKASLIGQTVTCTSASGFSCDLASTVVVSTGREFRLLSGGFVFFSINIEDSSIQMTNVFVSGFSTTTDREVTIGNLFWINDISATITGISNFTASGVVFMSAADITTFDNAIGIDFSSSQWDAFSSISFDIVTTAHGVPVAEPASLALFGIGLAGLGFMTRRR